MISNIVDTVGEELDDSTAYGFHPSFDDKWNYVAAKDGTEDEKVREKGLSTPDPSGLVTKSPAPHGQGNQEGTYTPDPLRPSHYTESEWSRYLEDRKAFHSRINEEEAAKGYGGFWIAVYEDDVVARSRDVASLTEALVRKLGHSRLYVGQCGVDESMTEPGTPMFVWPFRRLRSE